MNRRKVIIIHGNSGSTGQDHWFPYVKKKLEALGLEVISETMLDNVVARESIWLPYIRHELKADENTILIGHSSGAVATMRYVENNKIFGSVLVGACHTDLGDDNEKASGYYNHPWLWDKIRANQNWIIQFASTDDPYIPIAEARYIHKKLGTEYTEAKNEGHYGGGGKEKYEFPELVEAIKNKLY
jgi:predicted alpha/beta hydrolase family esterase